MIVWNNTEGALTLQVCGRNDTNSVTVPAGFQVDVPAVVVTNLGVLREGIDWQGQIVYGTGGVVVIDDECALDYFWVGGYLGGIVVGLLVVVGALRAGLRVAGWRTIGGE